MKTTFTLRELQTLESIIRHLCGITSTDLTWTLKIDNEIVTCHTLPSTTQSFGFESYDPILETTFFTSIPFSDDAITKLLSPLQNRFGDTDEGREWLTTQPLELLKKASADEILKIAYSDIFEKTASAVYDVTLLSINQKLEFLLVQENLPLQVLCLRLQEKHN